MVESKAEGQARQKARLCISKRFSGRGRGTGGRCQEDVTYPGGREEITGVGRGVTRAKSRLIRKQFCDRLHRKCQRARGGKLHLCGEWAQNSDCVGKPSSWHPYNSLQPNGPKTTWLLCPWNSPNKNTGVGSHSLLWRIFPTQGSNPDIVHFRCVLYHLSHQGPDFKIVSS